MDKSNLQRSKTIHSSSGAGKNYSNLNADLHARVKAFQEQRTLKRCESLGSKKSNSSQDSLNIEHLIDKPLPKLPGRGMQYTRLQHSDNQILKVESLQTTQQLGIQEREEVNVDQRQGSSQRLSKVSQPLKFSQNSLYCQHDTRDLKKNSRQKALPVIEKDSDQTRTFALNDMPYDNQMNPTQIDSLSNERHHEKLHSVCKNEDNEANNIAIKHNLWQHPHRQMMGVHQQKIRISGELPKSGALILPNFQGQLNPIRRAPRPPDVSTPRMKLPPHHSAMTGQEEASTLESGSLGCDIAVKPKMSLSARRGLQLPHGNMSLKMNRASQEFVSQPLNHDVSSQQNVGKLLQRSSRTNPSSLINGIQTTSTSSEKQKDTEGTEPSKTSNSGSNFSGGLFAMFSNYVDIKSGSLNFTGKLSLSSQGVDFSNGCSFRITLDELKFIEQLGHGNYGTVSKVLHKPTNIVMAMKEVRLELDESKFRQILMELEVLHKCKSPYIVDFYGAFFIEGAVYICMELMDGGSLDKTYDQKKLGGIEEPQLAFITDRVIRGLKELKDVHNVIHRDVKPTNILCSAAHGSVKLCDFGISGNLVASLAKTNIGCQSYMAPERIKAMNPDKATYSVQSDIWSLGLSIVEMAIGAYPYPPETYDNIFGQLSVIVDGPPPCLPVDCFSSEAQDFVSMCLQKIPELRPTYGDLLEHSWLKMHLFDDLNMSGFISSRLALRHNLEMSGGTDTPKIPALHMGGLKS